MKIKSTFIIIGLAVGLFACSRNSGVLQQPTAQNPTLKSSEVSPQRQFHMMVRGVNNFKFDSAGGTLTTIYLVPTGNQNPGTRENHFLIHKGEWIHGAYQNHILIWDSVEQFDDLLDMSKGIMGDLSFLPIPPGTYGYAIASVSHGWAYKNGKEYPVIFPHGQMILAFQPPVQVGEHLSPDLIINIDVSKSFVPIRHGTAFIFKPFVRVVNATTAGSLIGGVVSYPSFDPVGGAEVSVDVNGQAYSGYTLTESYTDPTTGMTLLPGEYWIPGIPGGTYPVSASKTGYVTADSTNVSILKGNFNTQNFVLMPQ